MSAPPDRDLRPFDRARLLARQRRAPVFVAGGEVLLLKPKDRDDGGPGRRAPADSARRLTVAAPWAGRDRFGGGAEQ